MPEGRVSDRDVLNNETMKDLGNGPPKKSIAEQVAEYRKAILGLVDDVDRYVGLKQKELEKKKRQEDIDRLKEAAKLETNLFKKTSLSMKAALKDVANNFGENLTKSMDKFVSTFSRSIDNYISTYSQYMGTISARLQGTTLSYNTMMSDISKNLATSPYVKQTGMIENLNKFVQSGITYNLELRSYLATVSDRIATTFDAFDSSLLRIIRIQQADSTTARLGMEALLTRFLNAQFGDTSYLSTGVSKNIASSLLEAQSQMGYKGSAEFQYTVQKWLGSLGAVGVSENALQSIATGLGYLGSGDITALSGNEKLQNLLVMAASRSGLDYGKLLTDGLSAEQTNQLLASLVGFGQEIASSSNNVVKSQYAQMFGMTISDLTSLLNLSTQDLRDISQNMYEYSDLIKETSNQLNQLSKRTSPSQMVSNVIDNLMQNLGASVATSPIAFGTWTLANLMANSGLDPTINLGFLGSGVSTKTSTLLKTGVIGISGITSLISTLGTLLGGNAAGTSLSVWGGQDENNRFKGNGYTSGISRSVTGYIGPVDTGLYTETTSAMERQASEYTGGEADSGEEMMRVIKDDIASTLRDKVAVTLTDILDTINNMNRFGGLSFNPAY